MLFSWDVRLSRGVCMDSLANYEVTDKATFPSLVFARGCLTILVNVKLFPFN